MKIFEVDWNDLASVSKLFNAVKTRYCELQRKEYNIPTKKERARLIFDACQHILNLDISQLYSGLILDPEPKYYVYVHLDTRKHIAIGVHGITTFAATLGMDYIPFYVGKGVGSRCFDTNRSETHRKIVQAIKTMGRDVKVFKIKENLTESQALQTEAKLIDIFGLLPARGYLTNLDEGVYPKERQALYKEQLIQIRKINEIL